MYVPAGSARVKEPSAAERTRATSAVPREATTLAPETRIGGHGDAARSTGQPGAARTVPATTAVAAGGFVTLPQAASDSVAARMSRGYFTYGSSGPRDSRSFHGMSENLLISEQPALGGLCASTLDYREQVGLLPAADRTPADYRLHGQVALTRARFIDRAKLLSLALAEIASSSGSGTRAFWRMSRTGSRLFSSDVALVRQSGAGLNAT